MSNAVKRPPLKLPLRQRLMMRFINFYPPFLGAGIRVVSVSSDWSAIKVRLALNWLNRNLFGTQFGGSLYAMCDPFFVVLVMQQLGPDYTVWDKAASIQFLRPGRGPVSATFRVPPERVVEIRAQADAREKVEPVFQAEVVDDAGQVVAQVEKRLWVRKKPPADVVESRA
jgi:acyl-coenzyme A thioesterase PaaI-like protein